MTRTLLPVLCIALLAGCFDGGPTAEASAPNGPDEAGEAPLREWRMEFTFSSVGSVQVAGSYMRPGMTELGYPLTPNCAVVDLLGPALVPVRVEANATWDVQPTEPELLAFAYIRAPGQDAVQDESVVGTSPLTLALDVLPLDLAEPRLYVGIHPSPDSPAGTGTTQEVAVSLRIQYRGERETVLGALYPCAYSV